ncbi:MAG: LPPG:FO 2-phospho-L-lactate transferase like, CofD-like [Firmicutes bacterium]|nr:LPPG:FO 2-phospho-L-lactate transferase like, CofD-like [Bacillota bacterium]MDI6704858.1 YvcK family protein [Bacillota bacterium]
MRVRDWLRPGLGIKRWLLVALIGVALIGAGISVVLSSLGLKVGSTASAVMLIGLGTVLEYISFRGLILSFLGFRKVNGIASENSLSNRNIIHDRILMKGPRVVVIGGGTGLSVLLRGMKNFTSNITAVVTVADDGGGSGVLRTDLGILPPGDIRNCILALADTEPVMEQLLEYRFKKGSLKGQSFGNLFIAAMTGISNSFEEAVKRISEVLAVTGKVLPFTLDDVTLYAQLKNGMVVRGESNIPNSVVENKSGIESVFIKPKDPRALPEVLDAINYADAIVLGPGSLFTSIIPNLLSSDIVNAINGSKAVKIYVCNIMTQPGETSGFTVSDHIKALEEHAGSKILDYVITNSGKIERSYLDRYAQDGSQPVMPDIDRVRPGIKIVSEDLVSVEKGFLRHDSIKLAHLIAKLANNNEMGLLDYYYLLMNLRHNGRVV